MRVREKLIAYTYVINLKHIISFFLTKNKKFLSTIYSKLLLYLSNLLEY